MWRCVECNQYPLNSNKHWASHTLHLSFLCGYWPHNLLLCFLARMGKKMAGKKERVRNHGGYYCAGDDSSDNVGVLRLRDDLMIESKQCRDRPECQAGRHHQCVISARLAVILVNPHCRIHGNRLEQRLCPKQDEQRDGCSHQCRY